MRFVGVDLARCPRNPTGAAVPVWLGSRAILAGWRTDLTTDREIVDFVAHGGPGAVVAIDGPLVVPNAIASERATPSSTPTFGFSAPASTPPTPPTSGGMVASGEAIVALLGEEGIPLAIPTSARGLAAACFDCYPHAALASLFHLRLVLRYKALGLHRSPEVRRAAYRRLGQHLRSLRDAEPGLDLPRGLVGKLLEGLGGRRLKAHEDLLDALVCGYTALHAWHWGPCGYRLFGDLLGGPSSSPTHRSPATRGSLRGRRSCIAMVITTGQSLFNPIRFRGPW